MKRILVKKPQPIPPVLSQKPDQAKVGSVAQALAGQAIPQSDKTQPNQYQRLMAEVGRENPAIGRQNIMVTSGSGQGYSETTPAYEPRPWNPFSNKHAVQVYESGQALRQPDLKNLLGGEALHVLGGVDPRTDKPTDPGFYALKQQFQNALTPQDLTRDRMTYRASGDPRPFDQWMQQSRLDAYLRPALFPMATGTDPGWFNYSPEQMALLQAMQQYIKK